MIASNILTEHHVDIIYSCSDSSTESHDFPVFSKTVLKALQIQVSRYFKL